MFGLYSLLRSCSSDLVRTFQSLSSLHFEHHITAISLANPWYNHRSLFESILPLHEIVGQSRTLDINEVLLAGGKEEAKRVGCHLRHSSRTLGFMERTDLSVRTQSWVLAVA